MQQFAEFAMDLRWTWSHQGDALWRIVDPKAWESTRNAHRVLQNLSEDRLDVLANDDAFQKELSKLLEARDDYMNSPNWIDTLDGKTFDEGGVAYFSMEFGLGEAMPLYAGGLGILAGDYLKAASDLGVPVVGVGLLYQQGYFRQFIDSYSRQKEIYTYNDSTSLPIRPARNKNGTWVHVSVEFPGRVVRFRVWHAQVGRVCLYLLDSNDPLNGAADRGITSQLYGGGDEMRLMQEIALGAGGWSALESLEIPISICHLNEGHAGFAPLQRANYFRTKHDLDFWDALRITRAGNVFTTHTPVSAAFDTFSTRLLTTYAKHYADRLGIDTQALINLGRKSPGDENEPFNMAYLASRTCVRTNAVSRRHGETSRKIFSSLYPRWPQAEVPIDYITNGVHAPTWDSKWADTLWTGVCGRERWLGNIEPLSRAIMELSDNEIWEFSGKERIDLVHFSRREVSVSLRQRGVDESDIEVTHILDPNALTLGFARRFTDYKRPNLLLHDKTRLLRLLSDPTRPVQLIVAGKAHPQDQRGKELIHEWIQFINSDERARNRIVFLEDYDISIAQEMIQGVDAWINTPRTPWEACGTSGMKVLVNGGLNISVADGWWEEAFTSDAGWLIPESCAQDQAQRDSDEANALYQILEGDVIPLFFERNDEGVPTGWVKKMRVSMAELAPRFSTNRMLREYTEKLYRPCAALYHKRCQNITENALALKTWEKNLSQYWHEMHFGDVDYSWSHADTNPSSFHIQAQVYLGEVNPNGIQVELYADRVDGQGPTRLAMTPSHVIPGSTNGFVYEVIYNGNRRPQDFTPRIVPSHIDALIPTELALIHWCDTPLLPREEQATIDEDHLART